MEGIKYSHQTRKYITKGGVIRTYDITVPYSVKNVNRPKRQRISLTDEDIKNILEIWDDLDHKTYARCHKSYTQKYGNPITYYKIRECIINHKKK